MDSRLRGNDNKGAVDSCNSVVIRVLRDPMLSVAALPRCVYLYYSLSVW